MATNLGDLLKAKGFAHSGKAEPPPEPVDPGAQYEAKVVLRATKKGRGGKTVTEIQGVRRDHDALASTLKKALGVGVTVEDPLLIVQGDQVDRLEKWLTGAGVLRVVRG